MNVLLIEDDQNVVNSVCLSLVEKFNVNQFIPTSTEKSIAIEELEQLCSKNLFDLALLDYNLWDTLWGYQFIGTLNKFSIPFVAFSGKTEDNNSLLELGACYAINKNNLYGSRGFDQIKFFNNFTEAVSASKLK